MRIVSGSHKSKKILAPKKLPVRPTTDRAKESLFNILNNDYFFNEIHVLDLFSGTGNISYEFASRGTKKIICVDQNYNCTKFINKTTQDLGFKSIKVIQSEVLKFLEKQNKKFDIIFADPPYTYKYFEKIISIIIFRELLTKYGSLVLEHGKENDFSSNINLRKTRRYGNVHFSFFNLELKH